MTATVIGASSLSGTALIQNLIKQGTPVRALVREASRLEISNEKMTVIEGDVLRPESIQEALKGAEVVFSFLGPKGSQKAIAARGTANIIAAMQSQGIDRLLVASVAGIAVPEDQRKGSLIEKLIQIFLKEMYADREEQLRLLQESSLAWTAARLPRLTNDTASGSVRAFFGSPSPMMKLSREGLADFLIGTWKKGKYIRRAPILAEG